MPNLDTLFDLSAASLRGDLATTFRDHARALSAHPWEKMTADEQQEFCDDCAKSADHVLREVVDIVATEGRETVAGNVAKVDNNGKVIKVTVEIRLDAEGRHALFDATGDTVNIVLGRGDAFRGGDVPQADKFGSLGIPNPDSEYAEADGHGVPDPQTAPANRYEPNDHEFGTFGHEIALDNGNAVPLDDVVSIAAACHEKNREYCEGLGDDSQPVWNDAPQWQRDSAINGVLFHLNRPEADDAASHENWMADKEADGWTFGEVKDPEAKTHPCMVPFDELPEEQREKDRIFRTTVWETLAAIDAETAAAEAEIDEPAEAEGAEEGEAVGGEDADGPDEADDDRPEAA